MKTCRLESALVCLLLVHAVGPALRGQTNVFPSSGNVGIGTTSPGAKLQIESGSEVIRNNSAGSRLVWQRTDDTQITGFGSDGYSDLTFITNNTEKIRVTSGGNVGIGTTSPDAKLQIGSPPTNATGAMSTTFVSYAGSLNSAAGSEIALASFGFGSANTSALGIRAFRTATYNGWETAAVGIGLDVDNTVRAGASIWLHPNGNIGIGTTTPAQKLSVNGTVRAKEVIVDTGWSDYVFAQNYRLAPLTEVETHIKTEGHLPGIPSAQEVAERGISLGEMQAKLLAKIEELTLHVIEQDKELKRLKQQNEELLSRLKP